MKFANKKDIVEKKSKQFTECYENVKYAMISMLEFVDSHMLSPC